MTSTGRKDWSDKAREQELLPGIPNHLTMRYIVPKVKWESCNVLLMVNKVWQRAIWNRSVYDVRLLCHSTQSFLVLLTVEEDNKFVATLYSCTDDFVLKLPPIPSDYRFRFDKCVCLEGKVHVWVIRDDAFQDMARVFVWVLDLAGDRKWKQGTHVEVISTDELDICYGVLDGQIYKFRGSIHPDHVVLGRPRPIGDDVDDRNYLLPQTKVYDPLSDVWNLITPEPCDSFSENRASIRKWARDEFGADHCQPFSTDGWYEPFFSEWRRKHCSAPKAIVDVDYHNENQVYYHDICGEYIFSFGGKLARFTRDNAEVNDMEDWSNSLELFDTQENAWNHWISVCVKFHPRHGVQGTGFRDFGIVGFASTDHVIWAVGIEVGFVADEDSFALLKSPVILAEDNNISVPLHDTGYRLAETVKRCMVRPIYV